VSSWTRLAQIRECGAFAPCVNDPNQNCCVAAFPCADHPTQQCPKQQAFGSVPWTDFARQAGILDVEQFDTGVNDTGPFERLEQSKKLGDELGVRGSPTVLVNGWKLPVTPSVEMFDTIVTNVVEGRSPVADLDFRATTARN
jgi:hypothetical protein